MTTTDPGNTALAALRQAYRVRDEHARRVRRGGTMVVAYAGHHVPQELIVAAGCFPLQISGDPADDVPLALHYLDDEVDGDVCSLFQRIVSGHYNFVDLIVLPRSSNNLLHLYYFLLETRRLLPQQHFPDVVLFDVLQTPFWSTGQYVTGRVLDLKLRLEKLTTRAIGDDAVRAAIASVNASRRALQALNDLRRRSAPLLAGSDLLRAATLAHVGEREQFNTLAQRVVAQAPAAASAPGMRLMVKGAPHDSTAFYELVEELGASIVADDHASGERSFERLVEERGEPLAALAQHYQLHVPGIRSFPQATQDQAFMTLVEQAGVQGVIFFHDEFDDTLGWDYPQQKKLLDERGIPSVFLQQQAYRTPDRAAQRAAVAALLAGSRP